MKKRAIITGVTGQDGSYLAELLVSKDYKVYGMVRRSSTENFERINHLMGKIELVRGDLLDQMSLIRLIQTVKPHVIYREGYQIFACSGILFNHESPRRGKEFVSRRISMGVAKIKLGLEKKLTLGNL